MTNLIVLLATVASLLANPKVQANPVYLAEAQSISSVANQLAEEYSALSAPTLGSSVVPSIPNQIANVPQNNSGVATNTAPTPSYLCKLVYLPTGYAYVDQDGNIVSTVAELTGQTINMNEAYGISNCSGLVMLSQ